MTSPSWKNMSWTKPPLRMRPSDAEHDRRERDRGPDPVPEDVSQRELEHRCAQPRSAVEPQGIDDQEARRLPGRVEACGERGDERKACAPEAPAGVHPDLGRRSPAPCPAAAASGSRPPRCRSPARSRSPPPRSRRSRRAGPLRGRTAASTWPRVTPSAIAVPISPMRSSTLIISVFEMLSTMMIAMISFTTAVCRLNSAAVLL